MAVRIKAGAKCELCDLLDGVASFAEWCRRYESPAGRMLWRLRDVHHCWTPPRWDAPANTVTACRPAHEYVERYSQFGRLVCAVAKIRSGTFCRETVRDGWGRDPIDAIHADRDGGLFVVPEADWEPFWILLSEAC